MEDCQGDELRRLERNWKLSNSLEAEVIFLRERRRINELTDEQLEIAAYLDHPAAVAIHGPSKRPEPGPHLRLLGSAHRPTPEAEVCAWVLGLKDWGHEILCRAALAIARRVLPIVLAASEESKSERLLRAATECLLFPNEHHARRADLPGKAIFDLCDLVKQEAYRLGDGQLSYNLPSPPRAFAAHAICSAAHLSAMRLRESNLENDAWSLCSLTSEASFAIAPREIWAVLQAELSPWVLGYGDPLKGWIAEKGRLIWPEDTSLPNPITIPFRLSTAERDKRLEELATLNKKQSGCIGILHTTAHVHSHDVQQMNVLLDNGQLWQANSIGYERSRWIERSDSFPYSIHECVAILCSADCAERENMPYSNSYGRYVTIYCVTRDFQKSVCIQGLLHGTPLNNAFDQFVSALFFQ